MTLKEIKRRLKTMKFEENPNRYIQESFFMLNKVGKKEKEMLFLLENLREKVYIPEVDHAYGFALLDKGDLNGFKYYHNRYKLNGNQINKIVFPRLSLPWVDNINRLLPDDRIIVLNEQGLGDEILFSRAIEEVSKRVSFAKWKVRPELYDFFKEHYKFDNVEFFVKSPLPQKEVNTYTAYTCTGDLFASMEDKFNLKTDPFKKVEGPVAISYTTNTKVKRNDELIPDLQEIRKVPGELFLSVLKRDVVDFSVGESVTRGYPNPKDFLETYENLKKENIQMAFAVDSAFAHFTGLLGIPTVLIINKFHSWRWKYLNEDKTSKFFPSIKVLTVEEFKKEFQEGGQNG